MVMFYSYVNVYQGVQLKLIGIYTWQVFFVPSGDFRTGKSPRTIPNGKWGELRNCQVKKSCWVMIDLDDLNDLDASSLETTPISVLSKSHYCYEEPSQLHIGNL